MQLFVREALAVTYNTTYDFHRQRQLMMLENNSELHGQHVLAMTHAQHKKKGPNKEHRCGASQIPSECQVRTSHNSRVLERVNYAYLGW